MEQITIESEFQNNDDGKHIGFGKKTNINKKDVWGWVIIDQPGELMYIDKNSLNVDYSYQRSISTVRVAKIRKEWSWMAAQVLVVVERDGKFYVVDGQHRLFAARQHPEIKELACLVFYCENEIKNEARAFILGNKMRSGASSVQTFKAEIVADDELSVKVNNLITSKGYHVGGSARSGNNVKCIEAIKNSYKINRELTEKIWDLCVEIHKGLYIRNEVWLGLFYIEKNIIEGKSLLNKKEKDKLISLGSEVIFEAVRKARSYYGSGGEKIYGKAILDLVNKGRNTTNKILLREKNS